MPRSEWFESWFASPYYRVLYEERDEEEAHAAANRLLQYLQPPPASRMLDIACGEGRFARALATAGHDVIGIDLSHNAIAAAKKTETDRLRFYIHDMRMPFYVSYFGYAFNFFTSFGYFARPRDHRMAARAAAAALLPGGVLVLDYLNTERSAARLIPEEFVERGGIAFHIQRRVEDGYFLKEIRFTDPNGRQRHYTEQVAAFTLGDFLRLFRAVDLQMVTTFGDYDLSHFHPTDSPRLITVFKKDGKTF